MSDSVDARWGKDAVDPDEPSLPGLKASFLIEHTPEEGKLLEIGCGEGKLLLTLGYAHPRLELHGTDVQAPLAPAGRFQFALCGASLPYADATFDCVVIFDVLEHVTNPEGMLDEALRVLRPGGRLVSFIPVEGEPLSFYSAFRALLGKDLYVETKEHVVAFRHGELLAMLERRFALRDVRYAYHLMGHLMDAAFFAAGKLQRVKQFWWKENAFYDKSAKADANPTASVLNTALKVGNLLAYWESSILARQRATSAGMLVSAQKR